MTTFPPVLHQLTDGAAVGDAITDQALAIRSWLREWGIRSELYAAHIHPELTREVRPVATYRPQSADEVVIYHHSIGSPVAELLLARRQPLLLIYHNVTPPEFFSQVDPALANQLREGRAQLVALHPQTCLALGDSPFNTQELEEVGFAHTGVLPIVLDESRYDWPSSPELVSRYRGQGPLLLFVGRLTPNKRQEDLLKLLYFYRRIEPDARLILVGSPWAPAYARWLEDLTRSLGLDGHVDITNHVSQQEMVTYYRLAHLYVSMSEHEGFGKPLVESMYFRLPVLAYAAASVPVTLGGAGVLFHRKDYEALAEVVDLLVKDETLRQRIMARQQERVQHFLPSQVKIALQRYLAQLQTLTPQPTSTQTP